MIVYYIYVVEDESCVCLSYDDHGRLKIEALA